MQEDKRKQLEQRISNLKKDIDAVCSKPEGIRMMKYFAYICGFAESTLVVNSDTQEIISSSTIYNEARRSVYIELRKFIQDKHLTKIEFGEK